MFYELLSASTSFCMWMCTSMWKRICTSIPLPLFHCTFMPTCPCVYKCASLPACASMLLIFPSECNLTTPRGNRLLSGLYNLPLKDIPAFGHFTFSGPRTKVHSFPQQGWNVCLNRCCKIKLEYICAEGLLNASLDWKYFIYYYYFENLKMENDKSLFRMLLLSLLLSWFSVPSPRRQ